MMKRLSRVLACWGVFALAPLQGLAAHEGHGAEHGWLAGALQPFLSLDHLLAAVFVALTVSLGLLCLALAWRIAAPAR